MIYDFKWIELTGFLMRMMEGGLFSGERRRNRYLIESAIGEGGFSRVYLAYDSLLERQVAIKVLHLEISLAAEAAGAAFDEARALALVSHPNIAEVHDAGRTEDGRIFIVSSYIKGVTLEGAFRRGDLSEEELIRIILEITGAVVAVHEAGLFHRDIKPGNILLNADGQPFFWWILGLLRLSGIPNG